MKRFLVCLTAVMMLFTTFAQKPPKRDKADVKKEKDLIGNFVYIPAGHTTIYEELPYGTNNSKSEVTVSAFYMLETEVTNKAYNAFLDDLKAQGRTEDYEKARTRFENWTTPMSHNESAKQFYDSSPAYQYYPAVNVPYEGAVMYCQWLNEKMGNSNYEYMLPTRAEWMWAAMGGNEGFVIYSSGPFLTNSKGEPLCAYFHVGDEWITRTDRGCEVVDKIIFSGSGIPYPAKCYFPNAYGLYNMSGNVAEMVNEPGVAVGGSWQDPGFDIRIASTKKYTGPTQQIGFRVILRQLKFEK